MCKGAGPRWAPGWEDSLPGQNEGLIIGAASGRHRPASKGDHETVRKEPMKSPGVGGMLGATKPECHSY